MYLAVYDGCKKQTNINSIRPVERENCEFEIIFR